MIIILIGVGIVGIVGVGVGHWMDTRNATMELDK